MRQTIRTVVGSSMLLLALVAPTPAPAPPSELATPSVAPPPSAAPDQVAAPTAAPPEAPAPPVEAAPEPEPQPSADPVAAEPVLEAEPAATDAVPETAELAEETPSVDARPPSPPPVVTVVHRRTQSTYYGDYDTGTDDESSPSKDEIWVSGYGGITTRFSAVARKMGSFRGGHGGLLIGGRGGRHGFASEISIGAAYHRLKRRYGAPIIDANDRPLALEMAYGGLELGTTVFSAGRFDLGIQTLIGAGAACLTYDVRRRSGPIRCVEQVRMMVIEPSALATVRVTDWMRIAIEGGYRGVARTQWRPPTDFDLSGGYFGFNLDFGWFGNRNDD